MVVRSYTELESMLESERTRLELHLARDASCADEQLGYGNHMAEGASTAFEQAKDLAVRACLADMLVDVEQALCKFALGLYGICERCGRHIDWARLEAKPEARLCIKCKQRSELIR